MYIYIYIYMTLIFTYNYNLKIQSPRVMNNLGHWVKPTNKLKKQI